MACLGQFMVVLDVSVVNVALPTIQSALGFSRTGLPWVVNGYVLTFAGFLLLGGRLADLYGRKRVFLCGLALFTAASLVGGLADTPGLLIAARALQGLGASVLAPATITMLTVTFPEGPARIRALATWTAVAAAGGTAGNLIGGAITEFLSWRWILLINVPLGAALGALTVLCLAPDQRTDESVRLDVPGALLATTGLGALTYGITLTRSDSWAAPSTITALALGVAALGAFVLVEGRFARAPLLPLRLLSIRTVSVGNVLMLLGGVSFTAMWYFLSLFMQDVLHYSAWQTGLGFLPHTLVSVVIGMHTAPWLLHRLDGRTVIVIGAVLAGAGFAWQSLAGPDSTYLVGILGPGVIMSLGGGLLNTPITNTVTSGVRSPDAGAASGLMNTSKQVGGALGLTVLVVLTVPSVPALDALDAGYSLAFGIVAAVLVGMAVLATALPGRQAR